MASHDVEVIANLLDRQAAFQMRESDDARAGTGRFDGFTDHPLPPGQLDLPTIAGVHSMIANAFADLASDLRNYA